MKKFLLSLVSALLIACMMFTACTGTETDVNSSDSTSNVQSAESAAPVQSAEAASTEASSADSSEASLTGLWKDATVTEDTTYGEGALTIQVEVKAEDKSVTLTVKTDKKTLGDALTEHNLIDGDKSEYGLYVKKVIGMTADYDVDQSYWSFSKNGEMMMTGVDGENISDGAHYEITYTK